LLPLHCCFFLLLLLLQLVYELRDVLDVKHFINNKLGISDRQVRRRQQQQQQRQRLQ
jgi:cellulose biosynthesis protein BcsQ